LYAGVAGVAPELKLEYLPSVGGEYADGFLEALERNLARDLAAGFTTIGPHREDWRVQFGGEAVGAVASRGEVRTLVLALKLAEMDYLEARTGKMPLLLLDDVFSELDSSRRASLINRLGGRQSIITTTDADAVVRAITSPLAVVRPEDLAAAVATDQGDDL
jgi:DNA replication and repair protein RecF